ncbi:MAG: methyl-accepting chemotaxis protein [Nitrospinota bacterium]|nr:MAG: methyl-accepting chemotaxis protein [Nitrospinota bacterium]
MLSNMSIKTKLWSGFLIIIVLFFAVGVLGYMHSDGIKERIAIIARSTPLIDAAMEMELAVSRNMTILMEMMEATEQTGLEGLWKEHENWATHFTTFAQAILNGAETEAGTIYATSDPALRSMVQDAERMHDDAFQPKIAQLYDLVKEELLAQKAQAAFPAGSSQFEELQKKIDMLRERERVLDREADAAGQEMIATMEKIEERARAIIAAAVSSSQDAITLSQASEVGALAIGLLLAFAIGYLMARHLSQPIIQITEAAQAIAQGDLDQTIDVHRQDEIGLLSQSFQALMAYLKGIADAVNALSRGELSVTVEARSEQDILARSFQQIRDTVQALIQEIQGLVQVAQEGQLHTRADAGKFTGAFAEIIDGINTMLDAFLAPIQEAAHVLGKVATRDLAVRVRGEYRGDLAQIKAALNTAIQNLDEGMKQVAAAAEQVSSAAAQISSGSQSLAQGASEQASSLQEIASSLQELASMSGQNTANAQETQQLSAETLASAEKGVESMQRLSAAIAKIKASADETAKIVKTIDDIAFQTNLLALNAAVEAARAGEAGKGFAVVAEEVRNLAIRSAEAAKNTAQMIAEAIQNVEQGVMLNQEALANLTEITTRVQKVSTVMTEIAVASQQQNQGIEQINTAVNQMNKVTQHIAATSEEAASAAEELFGQAETMQKLVTTFHLTPQDRASPAGPVSPLRREGKQAGSRPGKKQSGSGDGNGAVPPPAKALISLDGEDQKILQDF